MAIRAVRSPLLSASVKGAGRIGIDGVARKGKTRALNFLRETERHHRIFIEDDARSPVILDECRPELADGRSSQPLGLCRLQHRRNERQLALIGLAYGLNHAKVLDECRRGKIDIDSLRIFPARLRDRKSTRLNSSHVEISYAVFCLKKKKTQLIVLFCKLQSLI